MPYLLGTSYPVRTHTTPSKASALRASMRFTMACGCGECRILPISMPGTERSSVYFPLPVVLPAESISATDLPITENSLMNFLLGFCMRVSSRLLRLNRSLDCQIHLVVAGTAAEITTQRPADFVVGRFRISLQQGSYRDHEARRTVSALRSAPLAVCFLNCSQSAMFGDAFDGSDFRAVNIRIERTA